MKRWVMRTGYRTQQVRQYFDRYLAQSQSAQAPIAMSENPVGGISKLEKRSVRLRKLMQNRVLGAASLCTRCGTVLRLVCYTDGGDGNGFVCCCESTELSPLTR